MKKISWISLIAAAVIFVVLAVVGAVYVYEKMYPMAEPIHLPDAQNVTNIYANDRGGERVPVDIAELDEILNKLRDAEPTRIWSVNDYPSVGEYYVLELVTPEHRTYRYFVYTEKSKIYIESPYEGVYLTDQAMLDLVASYLSE